MYEMLTVQKQDLAQSIVLPLIDTGTIMSAGMTCSLDVSLNVISYDCTAMILSCHFDYCFRGAVHLHESQNNYPCDKNLRQQ